jgi:Fe-S-cluster containining protein
MAKEMSERENREITRRQEKWERLRERAGVFIGVEDGVAHIVGFTCEQCGACCRDEIATEWIEINSEDVARWENEERFDILEYVGGQWYCPGCGENWFGPWSQYRLCERCNRKTISKEGVELRFDERCPFLRKMANRDRYRCTIQKTKPSTCRKFPQGDSKCSKCGMPFHLPAEEETIEKCPNCGERVSQGIHWWAFEKCPAMMKVLQEAKRRKRSLKGKKGHGKSPRQETNYAPN